MIADSGPGTRWLLWATPFGWTELMRPFTAERPAGRSCPRRRAVLVLGAAAVACWPRGATSATACSRRVTSPPLRPFGLGSVIGLAARLELPGPRRLVRRGGGDGVRVRHHRQGDDRGACPTSLDDTLDKFGVQGAFVTQYFGVAFLLVATVVALLPAGQVGAAGEEETSGRLVHVLAAPYRPSELVRRPARARGGGVVVAGLLAGLGAWLGAASQGVDLGFATMLGAGLNVVPTALVVLGIGAVVLASRPRAARPRLRVVGVVAARRPAGLDGRGPAAGSSTCRCSTTWRWRPPNTSMGERSSLPPRPRSALGVVRVDAVLSARRAVGLRIDLVRKAVPTIGSPDAIA